VTLAVPDRFEQMVRSAGMIHHTLRPHPRTNPDDLSASGVRNRVRERVYPAVEETYRDLLSAAGSADLIAFPIYIFPGPMAAERLGIPWAVFHAAPCTLYSAYDPPYLPPLPWLYPLQRLSPLVSKLLDPIARYTIRSWSAPLHALRAREGFARQKGDLLLGGMRSPWLTLGLFSTCIGAEQRDWPKPSVVTGFPYYDEPTGAHAEEVERFLGSGEPPLVATLGSVVSSYRRSFLESMIEVAENLGRRLLLIAGPEGASLRSKFHSDSLLVVDYVPYSNVFPRSCAIVMAASMGPLSHGLRAGRPMILISAEEAPDQPDNARRAVRLGVGRRLDLSEASMGTLTAHLLALLSDPAYAQRAKRWAKHVNSEDGIARTCDALEATAEKRRSLPRVQSEKPEDGLEVSREASVRRRSALREVSIPGCSQIPRREGIEEDCDAPGFGLA
jgi:UDP:flavonoid glycosyltransferase YjiC (YdhE family)